MSRDLKPAPDVIPEITSPCAAPLLGEPENAGEKRTLFLDDDPSRAHSFLERHPEAVWVETVEECLLRLAEAWDEVHLDHDLGGKKFVDTNQVDCGMEVIRWLCKEPRSHLRETFFYIHTHNTFAGLLMVLQMRESGYKAEFRPFGFEFTWYASGDGADPSGSPQFPPTAMLKYRKWVERMRMRCRLFLIRFWQTRALR